MEAAADRSLACREEGSNGDREMAAAMWHAGLEPWDITMSDLLQGRSSLDSFSGQFQPNWLACRADSLQALLRIPSRRMPAGNTGMGL